MSHLDYLCTTRHGVFAALAATLALAACGGETVGARAAGVDGGSTDAPVGRDSPAPHFDAECDLARIIYPVLELQSAETQAPICDATLEGDAGVASLSLCTGTDARRGARTT